MRLILILLCLVVPIANADPVAPAPAFAEGRYSDAARLALETADADSFALAARAYLAEAMCSESSAPPTELVAEAEAAARQALALDPGHVDGRLQLAIALSLKSKPLSNTEALRRGWGEEARDLAISVLDDDPDNFYAHGFLAVWHLEVVRRGGSIGAMMLGASVKAARRHYWQTRAIRDGDPATSWQYARALAALDAQKHSAEIRSVLRRAVDGDAQTALEQTMQKRAQRLLNAMETMNLADIELLAREQL